MRLKLLALLVALALAVGGVDPGLASVSIGLTSNETQDAARGHEIQLTIKGVSRAAEAHFGGKVVGAVAKQSDAGVLYDIALQKPDGVTHVWLDSTGEQMHKGAPSAHGDNPHVEPDPLERKRRNRADGAEVES